jgi:hypothetical protein
MRVRGVHACFFCACLCAHLCACAGPCVRACLRARLCMRAFVCACERVLPVHRQSIFAHAWLRAHMCGTPVCVMPRRLCGRCGGTAATGGINSPAGGAGRRRALRFRFGATGVRCRARSAAGVTWTCCTANAGWAGREGHTSVVDAISGAIYVIGGVDYSSAIYFADVWVSRGRAARPRPNGPHDLGTRRWSTPPAPSTSSAATTSAPAPPATRTCGSAPTEARGPDSVGGVGRRVPRVGTTGGTRGYYKSTRGY